MPQARRWRWLVPGVTLLACVGVWLGHTLEYARVWGSAGLGRELTGSVHLYMIPAGVALTALLAGVVALLGRLRHRYNERVDRAAAALAGAWRARPVPARPESLTAKAVPPAAIGVFAALGAALAVIQVALYLIQENLETAIAGAPVPGLGAITGVHWAAPLIHLAVAFALAGIAVAVWSLFRRHSAAVERVERAVQGVLAALAARRIRVVLAPTTAVRAGGPLAHLGTAIWCRPPPLALIP